MTHDKLLANLSEPWVDVLRMNPRADKYKDALRAVVELHKAFKDSFEEEYCEQCDTYGESLEPYPCPTIQAIEKELG